MKKQANEFTLIDGTFSVSEANELLLTLFQNKLRFHRLKSFSHQEMWGIPDAKSEKRIQQLEQEIERISHFLKDKDQDEDFEIHANIKIEYVREQNKLLQQTA
ncbi:hypothetical protein CKK33_14825 [Mucilaginibacter sp. MD40]|uniref:hypothetical protein n=1 Tax=Mucilaginibacter sp. MD40 TaxID=2029590 RepID=UPI000BAC78B4|nr:hypothetical protein [Mucilaginibacter sp. MD40]PAW94699.1 hypothetical protein CKK33_14825 [Mucilaginibacter sp. MD40]